MDYKVLRILLSSKYAFQQSWKGSFIAYHHIPRATVSNISVLLTLSVPSSRSGFHFPVLKKTSGLVHAMSHELRRPFTSGAFPNPHTQGIKGQGFLSVWRRFFRTA